MDEPVATVRRARRGAKRTLTRGDTAAIGVITASVGGLAVLAALPGDALRSVVLAALAMPTMSALSGGAADMPVAYLGAGVAVECAAVGGLYLRLKHRGRSAGGGVAGPDRAPVAADPAQPVEPIEPIGPAEPAEPAFDEVAAVTVAAGAASLEDDGPVPASLDALVDAVGELLVGLRGDFGVRYGSRTWVEQVLPALGATPDDPDLTRDVLAVAALGAAGVCADVTALTVAHPTEHLVATAASLHRALSGLAAELRSGLPVTDLPVVESVAWSS